MSMINEIKDANIRRWWKWSFLYIFEKKNYKINFDKSVSFTKLSKIFINIFFINNNFFT